MELARNKELAAELKFGMLEAASGILADYLIDLRTASSPDDKRKYLELTHKIAMAAEDQKPTLPTFNIVIGKDLTFEISQQKPLDVAGEVIDLPPALGAPEGSIVVKMNADILQELIAQPEPVSQAPDPLAFLDAIV